MTRGLEDLLGLPHLTDIIKEQKAAEEKAPFDDLTDDEMRELLEQARILRLQKAMIKDNVEHHTSMTDLEKDLLENAETMMEMAYNSDPRSMRGMLEVANAAKRNAIDAINSKHDAKVKSEKIALERDKLLIAREKLALLKLKLQHEMGQAAPESPQATITVVEDRNDVIRRLREERKASNGG